MNNINKHILVLILFSITYGLFAQNANPDAKRYNHWIFGYHNYIDWTNDTPQIKTSIAAETEQMAVYSDSAGNLQLYFDGFVIRDQNHDTIIGGVITDGFRSALNGALFIPKPKNDSVVYLFYTGTNLNLNLAIINVKTGRVIEKKFRIHYPVTQGITSTIHNDGISCWLTAHEYENNKFVSYLITENGLLECPFIETVGIPLRTESWQITPYYSATGKVITLVDEVSGISEMFSTDIKHNIKKIKQLGGYLFPISAIPVSNNKLIIVEPYNKIYHFDLNTGKQNEILDLNQIGLFNNVIPLVRKDKLYIIIGDSNYLGYYQFVSDTFKKSNFIKSSKTLLNKSYNLFPNFPTNYSREYTSEYSYKIDCRSNKVQFNCITSRNFTDIKWTVRSKKLSSTTSYSGKNIIVPIQYTDEWTIECIVRSNQGNDTVTKTISIFKPKTPKEYAYSRFVCDTVFKDTIQLPPDVFCIKWDNLNSNTFRAVDKVGTYSVRYYDSNYCLYNDTINFIRTNKLPKPSLIFTSKDSLIINNYSNLKRVKYYWNTIASAESIKIDDTGKYWVFVTNQFGCKSDSSFYSVNKLKASSFNKLRQWVYPNPASNLVYIDLPNLVTIELFNIAGQRILNTTSAPFQVSSIASGVYLLKATDSNNSIHQAKIIIE